MRSVLFAAISMAVALAASPAESQTIVDLSDIAYGVGEQIPSGFQGVGARSMAMGGAGLSSVNDGSALYWNPGALTRVRRVELLGGLGHARPRATLVLGTSSARSLAPRANYTRLNAAVLSAPYPTYRGGLTFAAGLTRPDDFSYGSLRSGHEQRGAKTYAVDEEIAVEGGLTQFAMGLAVEISPTIALGVSGVWHRGETDASRDLQLVEDTPNPLPDSLVGFYDQHTRARGFGLVLGTTVELPAGLSLGAVARPPVTHTVSGDWSDEYHEAIGQSIADYDKKKRTIEYDIESPWEIGVGLSWSSYVATVAADIWFVDWSQARYGGAPYIDDAGVSVDDYFEDRYRQTVRWHIGAEALVPWVSTYLRLGYYSDPDPFRGPLAGPAGQNTYNYSDMRGFFTFGAGWLIDTVLAADVAVLMGGDEYSTGQLKERRKLQRAFLTVAFRL